MLDYAILSAAGKKGGSAIKHHWTDDDRGIIRRDYDGTIQTIKLIALKLGVTPCAVKGQIQRMGLAKVKRHAWRPSEIERLSALVHQHSIPQVAKILHRSPTAVKVKATRLQLGLRCRDGWYSKQDVAEILGVDSHKVTKWIESGKLKATWRTDRQPQNTGMAMWHILANDLREFIRRYPQELSGRNLDIIQVVEILVGLIAE